MSAYIGFTLMGMTFGPMGALLPELFPASVRYTGSGIAYNVSSILGAAVAPFIAVALWRVGGGSRSGSASISRRWLCSR